MVHYFSKGLVGSSKLAVAGQVCYTMGFVMVLGKPYWLPKLFASVSVGIGNKYLHASIASTGKPYCHVFTTNYICN